MDAGSRWAYRARTADPLVEVEVVREGKRKPARVLVRFIDDDFEGLQDWVPPARLKVPWSDVEALQANESRWERARALSRGAVGSVELDAADFVFGTMSDSRLHTGYSKNDGLLFGWVSSGPIDQFGLTDEDLLRWPGSFQDGNVLVAPWPGGDGTRQGGRSAALRRV